MKGVDAVSIVAKYSYTGLVGSIALNLKGRFHFVLFLEFRLVVAYIKQRLALKVHKKFF